VLADGRRLIWTDDEALPKPGETRDELTAGGLALLIAPRPGTACARTTSTGSGVRVALPSFGRRPRCERAAHPDGGRADLAGPATATPARDQLGCSQGIVPCLGRRSPVLGVVMLDGRHRRADVGEQLADLVLAGGQTPLGDAT